MKRILILIVMLASAPLFGNAGNAPDAIRQTRLLDGFSAVSVSAAIDVVYTQTAEYSVEVETSAELMPRIMTEVRDGVLRIYRENRDRTRRDRKDKKVVVYVSGPDMNAITVSSASSFTAKGEVKGGELSVEISSGGSVEGGFDCTEAFMELSSGGYIDGELRCGTVKIDSGSGATAKLRGKAGAAEIECRSGSYIRATDLICETVVVTASSGASAKVYVDRALDASASSGSSVEYAGNPSTVNDRSSSGGSVRRIR